jgi:PIN domain nuclease of toxin-antitoxin system
MNYLLDTHTLIWALQKRRKLSPKVKAILENIDNKIYVSAISFWEISLKYSLGKLTIGGVTPEQMPELAIKTGFELLPLHSSESASFHKLPLGAHRDPFDRMLVWQAINKEMILITKDRQLHQYDSLGARLLW